MGTCYWIGVRTGQDDYDAVAVWKAFALVAPWFVDPPRTVNEYVAEVMDGLESERDRAVDADWYAAAARWVWDKLELDKLTRMSAGVRVFNGDEHEDWMLRDGLQHRGGHHRPGVALVRVLGDSAEVMERMRKERRKEEEEEEEGEGTK